MLSYVVWIHLEIRIRLHKYWILVIHTIVLRNQRNQKNCSQNNLAVKNSMKNSYRSENQTTKNMYYGFLTGGWLTKQNSIAKSSYRSFLQYYYSALSQRFCWIYIVEPSMIWLKPIAQLLLVCYHLCMYINLWQWQWHFFIWKEAGDP